MGNIEFHDVGFRFDGRQENSLENVSFQVEPGQCVLIAGRSGSGKSTLLHCISGLIPGYYNGRLQGSIWIGPYAGEKKWQDFPLWKKARKVGAVFQDPRHQFFQPGWNRNYCFP